MVGVQSWVVVRGYRELLTHSVQQGGLALCNPVDTTSYGHAASKAVTDHLTTSLIGDPGVMIFNLGQHLETAQVAQTGIESGTTGARAAAPGLTWEGCSHCKVAGTMELCCRGMANSSPSKSLNGTILSSKEWRDNVCLQYNHVPQDMPQHCDGCGERMMVEHALACKTGRLVEVVKWIQLCILAFLAGQVEHKPRILSSAGRLANN